MVVLARPMGWGYCPSVFALAAHDDAGTPLVGSAFCKPDHRFSVGPRLGVLAKGRNGEDWVGGDVFLA